MLFFQHSLKDVTKTGIHHGKSFIIILCMRPWVSKQLLQSETGRSTFTVISFCQLLDSTAPQRLWICSFFKCIVNVIDYQSAIFSRVLVLLTFWHIPLGVATFTSWFGKDFMDFLKQSFTLSGLGTSTETQASLCKSV